MIKLGVNQYYSQVDSKTSHGDRMCFSSTCAMAVKYLQPSKLLGSNADDDYLKTVLKYGDTTESPPQIKACLEFDVTASFGTKGTKQYLLDQLAKGFPVATGILHKGPYTAPTGGGHWMLLIGATDDYGIFHDPYGRMDEIRGGYITIGSGGRDVQYAWKYWLPRWEVEGRGTGWYMSFKQETLTTNDWSGVKLAAQKAGAKFPQLVAAQWALESGYGKHTSGKNNYFGIKSGKQGEGSLVTTTEYVNGKQVTINDWFKDYTDLQSCVSDLVAKWYKDFKGYKGVNRAITVDECARLLVQEGYATDPNYADKLLKVIRDNG